MDGCVSDRLQWLTSFHEPLLPSYRHHTGLKNTTVISAVILALGSVWLLAARTCPAFSDVDVDCVLTARVSQREVTAHQRKTQPVVMSSVCNPSTHTLEGVSLGAGPLGVVEIVTLFPAVACSVCENGSWFFVSNMFFVSNNAEKCVSMGFYFCFSIACLTYLKDALWFCF